MQGAREGQLPVLASIPILGADCCSIRPLWRVVLHPRRFHALLSIFSFSCLPLFASASCVTFRCWVTVGSLSFS